MGIDLTLMPDKWPGLSVHGAPLGFDRLGLQCGHCDLFQELESVATVAPHGIYYYGDEGIARETENPYGRPVSFVTAGQIVKILDSIEWEWREWDAAVWAFIRALPPDRRVFLWFH
jgi:hypothetical protein